MHRQHSVVHTLPGLPVCQHHFDCLAPPLPHTTCCGAARVNMPILAYTTSCIPCMVLHVTPLTLITARPACSPIYFMLALPCLPWAVALTLAMHCLLKSAWHGTLLVLGIVLCLPTALCPAMCPALCGAWCACSIVGFTAMSKEVAPEAVMVFLNTLFALFDALCDKHGVMKVETAGDCYIVAGGILDLPRTKGREQQQGAQEAGFTEVLQEHDAADSAARVMAFAKDMMAASKLVRTPHNGQPVVIRIGLHTGNCVSGLIGQKIPKFAVFGDTMNVASRMVRGSCSG
ncbi:nucleotide cyclase [Haematococcus lacustris]